MVGVGGGLAGGCCVLQMGGGGGRGGDVITSFRSMGGGVDVADVRGRGKAVFLRHEGPASGDTE